MPAKADAPSEADHPKVRLDKWLWAARFFKTRSAAQQAIEGGKVHVNGGRVKSRKLVLPGQSIEIRRGPVQWTIVVDALSDKRGPASEAKKLYTETEESITARKEAAEERKMARLANPVPEGRPTKKQRRDLEKFMRGPRKSS